MKENGAKENIEILILDLILKNQYIEINCINDQPACFFQSMRVAGHHKS
jgi:hypothetical protein